MQTVLKVICVMLLGWPLTPHVAAQVRPGMMGPVTMLVLFFLAVMPGLPSSAQPLPQDDKTVHLGVLACGNSACHGSAKPWPNSVIQQDEFTTWHAKDRHAKAYETLTKERSKRIAMNLGLPNAHEAPLCLNCHTDNIPTERRSKNFRMSDGVACEACHGGAEKWLGLHVSGVSSRAEYVRNGMYPTEDPTARGKLCLSCHMGNNKKSVTHRLMGAGHPRLSFELDTFTAIQPAHYKIDDDYRKRKKISGPTKTWAIGQAQAAATFLSDLLDPQRGSDGIFPELTFFDCHACHHSIEKPHWTENPRTGLGPGIPRLNDSHLVMAELISRRITPKSAENLKTFLKNLHQASRKGPAAMQAAGKKLLGSLDGLSAKVAGHKFTSDDKRALLRDIVGQGAGGSFSDFIMAEQALMAASTLILDLKQSGAIDKARYESLNGLLENGYKALEKEETYNPADFVTAMGAVKESLG